MIGQLLLHYRVVEKIGEGGQGTVYNVIDTTLDRPAVIKVLPPDWLPFIKIDPVFKNLRSEARFVELLKSLGL